MNDYMIKYAIKLLYNKKKGYMKVYIKDIKRNYNIYKI